MTPPLLPPAAAAAAILLLPSLRGWPTHRPPVNQQARLQPAPQGATRAPQCPGRSRVPGLLQPASPRPAPPATRTAAAATQKAPSAPQLRTIPLKLITCSTARKTQSGTKTAIEGMPAGRRSLCAGRVGAKGGRPKPPSAAGQGALRCRRSPTYFEGSGVWHAHVPDGCVVAAIVPKVAQMPPASPWEERKEAQPLGPTGSRCSTCCPRGDRVSASRGICQQGQISRGPHRQPHTMAKAYTAPPSQSAAPRSRPPPWLQPAHQHPPEASVYFRSCAVPRSQLGVWKLPQMANRVTCGSRQLGACRTCLAGQARDALAGCPMCPKLCPPGQMIAPHCLPCPQSVAPRKQ